LVNLDGFDALVLTGCQISLSQAVLVHKSMRWIGLPSLPSAANLPAMKPALVSHAAARASLCAMLDDRLGPVLARHLRSGTNVPLWITSQPRYSIAAAKSDKKHVVPYLLARRMGDGPAISALFDDAAARTASAAGATFIPQHPGTIRQDMFTALTFMRGATRLAVDPDRPQPSNDFIHANARYGALVIDQVVAALTGRAPPTLPDMEPSAE
jgi:hypothetical protein